MWMEVAVVATIFAVGNILMGHWEAQTPKWRRLLKFALILCITLGISAAAGRPWAFAFLGLLGVGALMVHAWWLPRHGINGWTGEPKEKYYALRGWKYPPAAGFVLLAVAAVAQAPGIFDAVVGGRTQRTAEVSTATLHRILAEGSAAVFDARPHLEYAISHIPGARNVAAKPGVAPSMYVSDVAEVGRLVGGDQSAAIVLYCNGPHCGKSSRLADELLAAGYRNVRRYQAGIPVWRALGGVTEIESDGLRHVLANDRTAVVIDTRDSAAYHGGTLPNARHLPRGGVLEGKDVGEVRRAKDDGRLPMNDHNTRIIVVGSSAADARYVAEAIAREAFHNVAFYGGSIGDALAAVGR